MFDFYVYVYVCFVVLYESRLQEYMSCLRLFRCLVQDYKSI